MLFNQDIEIGAALQSGDLSVKLMEEKTRYSLRIKPNELAAFKKASGLKLPAKIGKSTRTTSHTYLCLGPDEWMVITTPENSNELRVKLEKTAAEFIYSYTDVSHRNVGFVLSGKQAASAINIGCPLDLSLDAFPIGKAARTVFENAPIMILRTKTAEFQLECWRSFAPYICGFFDRYETDISAYISE
ncbi:MAG: sarcosine oxidase subunit gamma family protein [Robiginitomaculum sp.]